MTYEVDVSRPTRGDVLKVVLREGDAVQIFYVPDIIALDLADALNAAYHQIKGR